MPADEGKSATAQQETSEFPGINSWGAVSTQERTPASVKGDFRLRYPFQWTLLPRLQTVAFDEHDIPCVFDAKTDHISYDPELVAAYGLLECSRFLDEGRVPSRYSAILMADWLLDHLEPWQESYHGWPIPTDFKPYGLPAPYLSARTLGLGLSLLLRIAILTNDARYENGARKAATALFLSVQEGGVVRRYTDGSVMFEEHPTKKPTLRLSGCLLCTIGLFDLAIYFEDRPMKRLFQAAIAGLRSNIRAYDTGLWVLFDLHRSRRLASEHEILANTELLRILSVLAEDGFFADTAVKWQGYLADSDHKRHYFWRKLWERVRLFLRPKKYGVVRRYMKGAPS